MYIGVIHQFILGTTFKGPFFVMLSFLFPNENDCHSVGEPVAGWNNNRLCRNNHHPRVKIGHRSSMTSSLGFNVPEIVMHADRLMLIYMP